MKEYVKVNLNNNRTNEETNINSTINCLYAGFTAEGTVEEIELFNENFQTEEELEQFITANNYNHDGLTIRKTPIYKGITVYAEKLNNATVREIITDRIIRKGDELSGYLSFSTIETATPEEVLAEYKKISSTENVTRREILKYAKTLSQIEKISIEKFEENSKLTNKTPEEKADIMIKNLIARNKRK